MMQNKSVFPSVILVLQGIGAVLGSIVMIEIAQMTACKESWLHWGVFCTLNEPIETWSGFKAVLVGLHPLLFGLFTIISGMLELTYLLVNYYLSPLHVSIATIFVLEISYLVGFITVPTAYDLEPKVMLCLCFVLTVIGGLIYNEMLILYFCGLERNTKKVIMDRGDEDDLDIIINMREINNLKEASLAE